MSASLVGSEMCIRDSSSGSDTGTAAATAVAAAMASAACLASSAARWASCCLLYTSDAADDM
eukprot:6493798-Alexandrium_andersonii.AAC.1